MSTTEIVLISRFLQASAKPSRLFRHADEKNVTLLEPRYFKEGLALVTPEDMWHCGLHIIPPDVLKSNHRMHKLKYLQRREVECLLGNGFGVMRRGLIVCFGGLPVFLPFLRAMAAATGGLGLGLIGGHHLHNLPQTFQPNDTPAVGDLVAGPLVFGEALIKKPLTTRSEIKFASTDRSHDALSDGELLEIVRKAEWEEYDTLRDMFGKAQLAEFIPVRQRHPGGNFLSYLGLSGRIYASANIYDSTSALCLPDGMSCIIFPKQSKWGREYARRAAVTLSIMTSKHPELLREPLLIEISARLPKLSPTYMAKEDYIKTATDREIRVAAINLGASDSHTGVLIHELGHHVERQIRNGRMPDIIDIYEWSRVVATSKQEANSMWASPNKATRALLEERKAQLDKYPSGYRQDIDALVKLHNLNYKLQADGFQFRGMRTANTAPTPYMGWQQPLGFSFNSINSEVLSIGFETYCGAIVTTVDGYTVLRDLSGPQELKQTHPGLRHLSGPQELKQTHPGLTSVIEALVPRWDFSTNKVSELSAHLKTTKKSSSSSSSQESKEDRDNEKSGDLRSFLHLFSIFGLLTRVVAAKEDAKSRPRKGTKDDPQRSTPSFSNIIQ